MSDINIEDVFAPNRNKLRKVENYYEMDIVDSELDVIKCTFQDEENVYIDTKDYEYILLSYSNLNRLVEAIEEASEKYYQETNK